MRALFVYRHLEQIRNLWKAKIGREHAHHFVGQIVQRNRSADDLRVGSETPPPQLVVQHDNAVAADRFLLRQKDATELSANAKHGKQICRRACADDLFWLALTGQVETEALQKRHALEGAGRPFPFEKMIRGYRHTRRDVRESGNHLVYNVQPVRIFVRKRSDDDVIDDAEDRGVGADADSQRQNRRHGEPGRTAETP